MGSFAYRARKLSGEEVTGTLAADSERGALDLLSRMQLFPLSVKEALEERPTVRHLGRGRRITATEVSVCYRQLADLLRAGVPLMRALTVLKRQTANPRLAAIVNQISEDVSRGSELTTALSRYPKVFSPLVIAMVRAGEQGGFLEDVLTRVAVFTEKSVELKSRVLSAMAYPIFLTVVGLVAVVLLVVLFVPRFEPMFAGLGTTLPAPTRILLAVSNFMGRTWWAVAGAILLAGVALARYLATPNGKLALDRWKLRVPAVGPVFNGLATSRFTRTLGTLLKSGVPILQALRISRDAANNLVFAGEIDRALAGVKEGQGLGHQLGYKGPFEPMVVDMIVVGEETGNLDQVLVDMADSYEHRVDRRVTTLVTLLEPVMLVLIAGQVGFIVMAMLLPVFTMSTQLQ